MFKTHPTLRAALASCALAFVAFAPCSLLAEGHTSQKSTAPDNSAHNKSQPTTADQQSNATSDRQMTAKIRRLIVADKSISTYGHNVKIVTSEGSVVLTGPVRSDDEKQKIASDAATVAGQDKVDNQLTIKAR